MIDNNTGYENTHKEVEHHAHLNDDRHCLNQQHAEDKNTVFQHEIPDDLADGLVAGDQKNKSDNNGGDGRRHQQRAVMLAARGSWPAISSAKAVARAPRMMDGRNPISGSTSRLICASRSARIMMEGMTAALDDNGHDDHQRYRNRQVLMHQQRNDTPSSMPCAETVWMTALIRLVPRANRFITRIMTRTAFNKSVIDLPHQKNKAESAEKHRRDQQTGNMTHPEPGHDGFYDADHDCQPHDFYHKQRPVHPHRPG
jgi:hypothetical protein